MYPKSQIKCESTLENPTIWSHDKQSGENSLEDNLLSEPIQ